MIRRSPLRPLVRTKFAKREMRKSLFLRAERPLLPTLSLQILKWTLPLTLPTVVPTVLEQPVRVPSLLLEVATPWETPLLLVSSLQAGPLGSPKWHPLKWLRALSLLLFESTTIVPIEHPLCLKVIVSTLFKSLNLVMGRLHRPTSMFPVVSVLSVVGLTLFYLSKCLSLPPRVTPLL